MGTPVIQPSFAAGELAPALHARVDLAKFHIGLATCLNFMIMATGGAQNRPGTAWVGPCIAAAQRSRLIPFQFNVEQQYALEFGDLKMRVIKDGGYVTEASKAIVSASNGNPVVLGVTGHGWSNGDLIYVSGAGGMVELNGRFFTAANVAANTLELQGIDGTSYGAWTAGGTAARVYTLVTPYALADLPLLKYTQSNDVMTLVHPGYAPRDLSRSAHDNWSLATITFAAEQPPPTAVTATPSSVSGAKLWNYVVTAVNATTGEESKASVAPGTATFKQEHDWNATTGDYIHVQWTNAAGAESYNVYKERNGIYGFIGNSSDGTIGLVDDKIRSDSTDAPPGEKNPFSGAGEWPGCVTYHDQRKFFGGSTNKPQTIWATAAGSYKNMNTSSPSQDDDAITRTLASRQANVIRHLVSMSQLIVFTSGAEWLVWPGSQSDVLTPANMNAKAQAYSGASDVPPLVVNDSILFVQDKGSIVRDLRYQLERDGWTGVDLSVLAEHLFINRTIEEWAWHQVPYKVVWAVRDDGVLLGFTYMKDQEVYAWSRHVTQGTVESVCAIGEGNEDVLYLTVAREVDGQTVRYVERMASRSFERLRDAWFLDCAAAYDGNNDVADDFLTITGATYALGDSVTLQATGHAPFTAASVGRKFLLRSGSDRVRVEVTAYTDTDTVTAKLDQNAPASLQAVATADWALMTSLEVTGLWHLEGLEVHVLADGNKMPPRTVASGRVALESWASRVLVGLPYDCDLETLNADTGQPTIQGKEKRVGKVVVRVDESRGLMVGPDESALTEVKERTSETYGEAIALFTGDREVLIEPRWEKQGRVYVRGTPGLPARVLAVIPRLAVGG